MASNFWTSNHRALLLTEEQAEHVPAEVLRCGITAHEVKQIKMFFCHRIFAMVASLKATRLRVATTACMYFHRFFHKYTFLQYDPRTIVPACVYVAVKVEECGVQKTKVYTQLAFDHDATLALSGFNTKLLLDREVLLLQAFDCNLIVFSAHTELARLLEWLAAHPPVQQPQRQRGPAGQESPVKQLGPAAWSLLCDVHATHACVVYAPGCLALAAVLLAAELLQVKVTVADACARDDVAAALRVVRLVLEAQCLPRLSSDDVVWRLRNVGY